MSFPTVCADMETRRLRKENASLKKALNEMSRQKDKPADSLNKPLLERILCLETIREKNSQALFAKDEEIASLREKLRMKGEECDAHLQELTKVVKRKEQREKYLQTLQTKTEEIENKFVTMSEIFQDLERRVEGQQALEKNQQWLAYDQEREAYVKASLARMSWLEQQLTKTNQEYNEVLSDEGKVIKEMQELYDKLLLTSKKDLEVLTEQLHATRRDQEMHWRYEYEERQREVDELKQQLQTERRNSRTQDLQSRLDEEQHRSAELLVQLQIASKDLDDEKQDCLYLQKQLHRVLKEPKNKDHAGTLCQKDQQDPSSREAGSQMRLSHRVEISTRIPGAASLDESFLECPACRAQYPSSQHRELLLHLEHCLD
ncbi:centrosomal protein of 55 kDa-like [Diretmus argenteus]